MARRDSIRTTSKERAAVAGVEDNHIKIDEEPHNKYQVNADRPLAFKDHFTHSPNVGVLEAIGPTEPDWSDSFLSYRI